MRNENKTKKKWSGAFILGAASDIAIEFLPLLAKDCETIYLSARKASQLQGIKKKLERQSDAKIYILDMDLMYPEKGWGKFKKVLTQEIDLFVCFTGVLGPRAQFQIDEREIFKMINVNFTQVIIYMNAMAQKFYQQGYGTLVGVSSVAGLRGRGQLLFYSSAKAALNMYMTSLRCHLYHRKIRVLTILPGPVATKMLAKQKLWPMITCTAKEAAKDIYSALNTKKKVVYVRWIWRYIMWIIRMLPDRVLYFLKI